MGEVAKRLTANVVDSGLPRQVVEQIQADIEEIGMAVAKMIPSAEKLIVKVEIMGKFICNRWHRDHYSSRAIVSYNLCGTEYALHENVDFWELENCGNNECIIRDKSQVFSVEAADVLFMKGLKFANGVNGLVHKSPEKLYHENGAIMNRLCLKIDVP